MIAEIPQHLSTSPDIETLIGQNLNRVRSNDNGMASLVLKAPGYPFDRGHLVDGKIEGDNRRMLDGLYDRLGIAATHTTAHLEVQDEATCTYSVVRDDGRDGEIIEYTLFTSEDFPEIAMSGVRHYASRRSEATR